MKKMVIVLLTVLFTVMFHIELRGEEPVATGFYLERVQRTAEAMEVFPIDLIARDGPLSFFKKDQQNPSVSIREEIDSQSFKLFYDFCQHALDATSEDIDACVDYLPQATAKEKALILAILYIYVYPYEKQQIVIDSNYERDEYDRFRSWFSLQYPCGAFDLTIRENRRREEINPDRFMSIVAQYQDDEEIAFPEIIIKRENPYRLSKNVGDWIEKRENVAVSVGLLDAGYSAGLLSLTSRKRLIDEIRQKRLDSCVALISDVLYVTYWEDLCNGVKYSYSNPVPQNTSEKPKTLGQIARQLLESWDPPQTIDVQE